MSWRGISRVCEQRSERAGSSYLQTKSLVPRLWGAAVASLYETGSLGASPFDLPRKRREQYEDGVRKRRPQLKTDLRFQNRMQRRGSDDHVIGIDQTIESREAILPGEHHGACASIRGAAGRPAGGTVPSLNWPASALCRRSTIVRDRIQCLVFVAAKNGRNAAWCFS